MKLSLLSLCIFVLYFWGKCTGLVWLAFPMIFILFGSYLIKWRCHLSSNDLKGIFKLCGGMFGLLVTVFLITQRSFSIIYLLLQWLPVCLFPLIAAQAYSTNFSSIFRLLFSHSYVLQKELGWKQNPINLCYPYVALCLLSASATNTYGRGIYNVTALVVGIILWQNLPKRSTPILWAFLLLLAIQIGYLGHLQLHQFQGKLEQQTAPWLSGLSGDSVDPYQANTRMGSVEDLKQSNAIVFRVAGDRSSFPIFLREATYNKYGSASWVAMQSKFTPVPPNPDGKTWNLGTVIKTSPSVTVSSNLNNGKGVLRLPSGTSVINHLPVEQMKKNQYGTVKIEGAQAAISYQIQFNPNQSGDSLPTVDDLQIPDSERSAIQKTLQAINIKGTSNPEVLDQVSAYFKKNFQYSLRRSQSNQSATPLSTFLLKSHSGHCEYFASATTLLLREAGIPARYAVGYSVDEFSPLEGQYIVRSRDAHAWVMAYVDGNWRSLDTTPSSWGEQEDAAASPLQAISDLWAFVGFKLASDGAWIYGGAIGAIATFFLWKWSRKFRVRKSTVPIIIEAEPVSPIIPAGLDSEFYLIEKRLEELNLKRIACESLQEWIIRLSKQLPESLFEPLKIIITLHNRYRFDPQGLTSTEREKLRFLSQIWLDASKTGTSVAAIV